MKSTLIELPPEAVTLEEDSFVEASSAEELAQRADISSDVLGRLFLPGRELGPYRVLGYVASGGMGDIYAAERVMEDGRRLGPVALKVIAPELRGDWQIEERFKREAAIGKAIRSNHVTRVYEFGESEDGYLFLSMELLHGEELFDRVATLRKLDVREVARIMLSVLQGLHVVHTSGFIHRDLKPENIFFSRSRDGEGEVVKILDFGIAKRSDEPSDPFLSVVGKIYGTPEYIAPEQGLNPDVDARADLYSVGIMMHECITGRLPFRGTTAYATILSHQNDAPPPLDVPPGFGAIVMRALAKKPRDRYQSAAEFLADLRSWYVREYDDEFSASLRDSAEMAQPRLRQDTPQPPESRHMTPTEPTPVPNLMPTRRQVKAKSARPVVMRAPPELAPPPVAQSHAELPIAASHAAPTTTAPVDPTPGESSFVAGFITVLALIAILASLVYVML